MGDVFETTDAELAEHVLRESYGGGMRLDTRGRHGGIRLDQARLTPSVRLDHLNFSLSFDVRANPLGVLVITHIRAGRIAYGLDSGERRCGPGDVSLAVQPEHKYAARAADLEIETAVIDPMLLGQVAETKAGQAAEPVRLTGYEPVSDRAAQHWKAAYAYVRGDILARPEAAAQPLLTANAEGLLAAVTLATFPSNALAEPTAEDRHDAHPAALRRTIAFIDQHAHQDISIADIAAAANVTARAVQLAFRRHMDTTPMGYLRRVRLDRAHRELLAGDPDRETVTAVAYRWGFSSPSRLAIQYRAVYGVTPSRTLRG